MLRIDIGSEDEVHSLASNPDQLAALTDDFIEGLNEEFDEEDAYLRTICALRVEGVLLTPSGPRSRESLELLARQRIQVVLIDREVDGRWIAEVPDLAGVLTYGATREEAVAHVQALALRVIADRLEHNEAPADLLTVTFRAA